MWMVGSRRQTCDREEKETTSCSCRYIKDDGSLWLLRTEDNQQSSFNVTCPFNLNAVVGFAEKIAVSTADGEILIRIGCTLDRLEGDGWIFIQHKYVGEEK